MDVREALFPYGMEMQEDGSWVFFNRDYKPAGINTKGWVDYNSYPVKFKLKPFGGATREKLRLTSDPDDKRIYFYDDATQPTSSNANMQAYLNKLETIMRLEEKHD